MTDIKQKKKKLKQEKLWIKKKKKKSLILKLNHGSQKTPKGMF